jgi:hypothetical protein
MTRASRRGHVDAIQGRRQPWSGGGTLAAMTSPQRRLLVAALFLGPVLLTASELLRLRVDGAYSENEADPVADAASHLAAVGGNLTAWHAAGFLTLGFVVVWGVALIGMAALLGERKPRLGAVGVVAGVLAIVGSALHVAFYYLPLGDLATAPDAALAARAAALGGHDPLASVALLLFLAGALAPVFLAVGLWRASVLPWWAMAAVLAWFGTALVGAEQQPAALLNLLLLVPAAALSRRVAKDRKHLAPAAPVPA